VGPGEHPHPLDGEELPGVVHDLPGPQPPHQAERLVEATTALGAGHAEGLLLHRIDGAQAHRRQEPPRRQHVQGGHLLGQHDGVAARDDQHGRAQLEALGAAGGDGQRHHRVGGRAADALGEPQ
jgi:hypothetical protein